MDETHLNRVKKPSLQTQNQLNVPIVQVIGPGENVRRSSVGIFNSSSVSPHQSGMEETPVGKFVDERSSRQEQRGREDSKRRYSLIPFNYDQVEQPKRKESITTDFGKIEKGIWNIGGEVIALRKTPTRKTNSQPLNLNLRKGSLQPVITGNKEIRRKSMPSKLQSISEPIPNNAKKKMNDILQNKKDKNKKKLDYSSHEEETVNFTFSLKRNKEQEPDNFVLTDSYENVDVAYTLIIDNPYPNFY